jgi:hypothetical protein
MARTTRKEEASAPKAAVESRTKSPAKSTKTPTADPKPTNGKPKRTAAAALKAESVTPAAPARRAPVRTKQVTVDRHAPTSTQIAERAYQLYLARGAWHGHDMEDWLEAERQLTGTHS